MATKKIPGNQFKMLGVGDLESPPVPPEKPARTGKRRIGFLAGQEEPQPHKKPVSQGLLYSFDEGNGISFQEGAHNVLVLGGTGRGKTSSVILPALDRLLGAGFGGLVIDVKGNFTEQTRSLARLHGRETDIMELGTAPSTRRINLLSGLDLRTIARLLRSLALQDVEHTSNVDWHEKGVNTAMDAAQLLLFLAEREPCFAPRLSLLHALCTDYGLACSLFAYFKAHMLDTARPDHAGFIRRLQNVHFHIFTPQPNSANKSSSEWERQMSWNLQRIREVLARLCDDPDLVRNFSANTGEMDLDFARLVYREKKVVILRFGVGSSAAGTLIARFIKERFYQDVYRNGLHMLEPGQHTFLVADEFQDIMDVNSTSDLNDFSWFSKSREFRNINLVASQSMASLYAKAENRDAVVSLLSNCSTKLILQLDDPETLAYLAAYPGLPVSAQDLGRGRALLLKYDLADRIYTASEQGLQNSHDSGQSRLQLGQASPEENAVDASPDDENGDPSGLPAEVLDKVLACDPVSRRNTAPDMSADLRQWPRLVVFYKRYKAFMSTGMTADHLAIPPGWMSLVEATMARLEELDVPLKIRGIGAVSNALEIELNYTDSPAQAILAQAQKKSRRLCMQCGKALRKSKARPNYYNPKEVCGPLCKACRRLQPAGVSGAEAPRGLPGLKG
ncbi:MAG TPA: hypothetical protein PKB11_02205 [Desulfovibrio sp.]|uniref:hypothetical protein n=1 Tax=Desulfovibrio sp. TaxID=885 RepID=UPI002C8BDEE4|nr:hypothetical protein [Desulfovibrio sp.]HMM37546.1 hypothetical protein [Desulfovibrio sp.]